MSPEEAPSSPVCECVEVRGDCMLKCECSKTEEGDRQGGTRDVRSNESEFLITHAHLLHEAHALKVQVLFRELFKEIWVVDALRPDQGVVDELCV